METNTTAETADYTVNQILDKYQLECMDVLAPRTRRDYGRQLLHLRRAFGHRIAAELMPKDFGDHVAYDSEVMSGIFCCSEVCNMILLPSLRSSPSDL